MRSEETIKSRLERQYFHFKHNAFGFFLSRKAVWISYSYFKWIIGDNAFFLQMPYSFYFWAQIFEKLKGWELLRTKQGHETIY